MSSSESEVPTSASNASRTVPARPTPPSSLAAKAKQVRVVLSAIEFLREIQTRGDYISSLEVQQLREALKFATGEDLLCGASTTPNSCDEPIAAVKPSSRNPVDVTAAEAGDSESVSALQSSYQCAIAQADSLLTSLEQYAASKAFGVALTGESIFERYGGRLFRGIVCFLLEVVVVSVFSFIIGGFLCLFATGLLLYSKYTAPFMLAYLIFIFSIGRPQFPQKKNMQFARCRLWRYYRDYFPIRCVVPPCAREKMDNRRNYMFLYHPHGVLSFGAFVNFALDANQLSEVLSGIQIHLQTLKINFFMPFFRSVLLKTGCGDASAATIRRTLRAGAGKSVLLVLGGAEEAFVSRPYTNDLILFKRKGFIQIALQEGASLVPVYGFGENNVYENSPLVEFPMVQRVVSALKRLTGVAIPIVRGAIPVVSFLPIRRPITVVIGEPIELPKISSPTDAEIDYWRGKYIEALQSLYETYRGVYDLKSTGLRVVK